MQRKRAALWVVLLGFLVAGQEACAQYPYFSSRPNIHRGYDYSGSRGRDSDFSARPSVGGGYSYSDRNGLPLGSSRPNIHRGYDYSGR